MPLFDLFASVRIESVLQRDLNLLETVELHREIQNVVDRDSTSTDIKIRPHQTLNYQTPLALEDTYKLTISYYIGKHCLNSRQVLKFSFFVLRIWELDGRI